MGPWPPRGTRRDIHVNHTHINHLETQRKTLVSWDPPRLVSPRPIAITAVGLVTPSTEFRESV